MSDDVYWVEQVFRLAERAVLVWDGGLIGSGWN